MRSQRGFIDFRPIILAFRVLVWITLIFVPLGLWKAGELVFSLAQHVRWGS